MTKTSRQKYKYLENETSFQGEIKSISSFLENLQLPKIVSDLKVCIKVMSPSCFTSNYCMTCEAQTKEMSHMKHVLFFVSMGVHTFRFSLTQPLF